MVGYGLLMPSQNSTYLVMYKLYKLLHDLYRTKTIYPRPVIIKKVRAIKRFLKIPVHKSIYLKECLICKEESFFLTELTFINEAFKANPFDVFGEEWVEPIINNYPLQFVQHKKCLV
jgi:hypothetical protein